MIVYVLLNHSMGTANDVAVCASKPIADGFIEKHASVGRNEVVEHDVIGDIEQPGRVFTASVYEPTNDVHNFVGVYGNFALAKRMAGERGLVLGRNVISV